MNSKKAGIAFFLLMIFYILMLAVLTGYYWLNPNAEEMSIITNLIMSELLIVIPVMTVVLIGKKRERLNNILGFRKIKISTALMTVLFTILIMPLATFFNAISMLFVENTVASMTGDILDVPFFVMFLLVGVYGAFCVELVFMGVIYRCFRK